MMTKLSLQQFIDKYNGKSVDFDGYYGYQCVDLFNFYNEEVVGAPRLGTPLTNGARDLFEVDSAARRAYYDVVSASAGFNAGDVLVYGEPHGRAVVDGRQIFFGHVNIYIGDNQVIEQRGRKGEVVSIDPLFTNGLLGVLRPRSFETHSTAPDVPDQNKNKNKHIIASGDTFWGLEEQNGWEHGTLQALNPEMVATELQIGDEMIIPSNEKEEQSINETYYTISRGDTFWGLENAWNLKHGTLQNLNPDLNPRTLQIGQSIRRS